MTLALRLQLIALAMIAVLAGLVGVHAVQRATGTELVIAMEPVDPRDILLGHYVVIRTPVHTLDLSAFPGAPDGEDAWGEGDEVFVAMAEGEDGLWRPERVAKRADALDPPLLRGRIENAHRLYDYTEWEPGEAGQPGRGPERIEGTGRTELQVKYNLERYYADPETAKALEDMRRENRLALIVSVGEDGGAVIKGLVVDGEPRYDTLF